MIPDRRAVRQLTQPGDEIVFPQIEHFESRLVSAYPEPAVRADTGVQH